MKMYAIVPMVGGSPDIDLGLTPYSGFAFCDQIGDYGAYLFGGTPEQMDAIAALPNVISIIKIGTTKDDKESIPDKLKLESIEIESPTVTSETKWEELEKPVDKKAHSKLDTWLVDNDLQPTVENKTYKETIEEIYKRFNSDFDLRGFDIAD